LGRKAKATTITVTPGLLLKLSAKSPYYQCYCRIKDASHRKSTGKADLEAAKQEALEWFFELKKQAKAGVALKRMGFDKLADNYLKTVIGDAKWRYHSETTERHFKPYFSKFDDIKQITEGTVSDYVVQRRTKSEKEPTPQTLNRENTVLRQMLAYAHTQKWMPDLIKVTHHNEQQTARRRRHFTGEEYLTLLKTARDRIAEAKADRQIQHIIANRYLLYDVIVLLANSGLRVDEMHSLTWRMILWDAGDIQLERSGKRKSSRRLIVRKSAMNALTRIAKRRKDYLLKYNKDAVLDPNERVIATPDGIAVKSLKTAFRALIVACGFVYEDENDRHSLTSLRHTYATMSLTRKLGQRPTQEVLAKQMGTSTRMIQAHYGHDSVEDYRDELRGTLTWHEKQQQKDENKQIKKGSGESK
jgi:integrase